MFAGFEFNRDRQELSRNGQRLPLTPKSLLLLEYLLRHPGRVLRKDELMAAVWGGVVVTDDSLVQCVRDLRGALGDKDQKLIRTLQRRGYMLDTVVREPEVPEVPAASAPAARPTHDWRRWGWLLLALMLLASIAAMAWRRHGAAAVNIDEELRHRRSVAVLSFSDKQGRAQGSVLADELADAITARLVHAGVRVISRAATVRQNPAAPEFERIGQEQNVRYVLAGRVVRVDGKATVDTYLTEIDSGAVYRLHEAEFPAETQALQAGYGRDVLLALQARYSEIEVDRARMPGHEPDPVDQIAMAWRDLNRGSTSADVYSARQHFETAADADPSSSEAALGLGLSHLAEFYGYYSAAPGITLDHAERNLKRALELSPDSPRVLSAWGEVLQLRGRSDDAFWVWQRALEIAPDSPGTQLRVADALVKQGRHEQARARLDELVDLRPFQLRRQQVLNQILANTAFAQGEDDEAYRILKRWAAEFPGNGTPYLMMAAIDVIYERQSLAASHMARLRQALPNANLAYVIQNYPSDNPQFLAQRARLTDALRKAGLPEAGK